MVGFDFSGIQAEIAKMDRAFVRAAEGDALAYVYVHTQSRVLADKIAKTLAPALVQVTPYTPPEILVEMDIIYSRMVSLAPSHTVPYMMKGNFYGRCGEFEEAANCFKAAYNIAYDPTREKWPHVEPSKSTGKLMVNLGLSLYHSGDRDEGQRFLKAGQKMMAKIKAKSPSEKPPEPL